MFDKIVSALTGRTEKQEESSTQLEEAESEDLGGFEFNHSADESEDTDGFDLDRSKIEYDGSRFHCQYSKSPNGRWSVAYGRSFDSGEHRFFLIEDGDIRVSESLENVGSLGGKAAVADNGVTAVIDNLATDELSGKLYIFDSSGNQLLSHVFDANVETCAISGNGEYVAAATLNPDCSTYIFSLEEGRQVLSHENLEGNKMGLEFGKEDGEVCLYLFEDRDGEPFYGVNLEGDVVWKSDELQRQDRLQELMESSKTDDLEEALELLEEAYELAEDENEKKNVAQQLADTHWSLAKEIKSEEGDTDEWWSHLNQAKTYYTEILPWYDGKQGVAKVSRKQGKYHLNQGNEDTALELFQSIADLEEEYDVQLLTDADKRRIKELSES